MSLVVAQNTEEGPRIVSDTRVTFIDERRPAISTDCLKAVVVARDTTVCFAGDRDRGLAGIRHLAQHLRAGGIVDGALPALADIAAATGDTADFLVVMRGANSSIVRITRTGIERDLSVGWIGDAQAFEYFQAARSSVANDVRPILSAGGMTVQVTSDPPGGVTWLQDLPPSARVMQRLKKAMDTTIANPAIPSVDGFCISIASKPEGFRYFESTEVHLGRSIELKTGDNLVQKMLQPVETGSYAFSVVPPVDSGIAALGLSFPAARLAMIYLPLLYPTAEVLRDVRACDFPAVIRERYGIAMQRPMLPEPA
jgi:hypothetical protein